LMVGNPLTGRSKDHLSYAEKEVKELQKIFKATPEQVLMGKDAKVSRTLELMKDAHWIFLACHGQAGVKPEHEPYSVFEGHLKLTPDEEGQNGYLHAEDIAKLNLSADLVVLSACYSGTGKIQQEGTI